MKLEELRKRIDLVDRELVQLLETRMEYAMRSTRLKTDITDTEREKAVLANACGVSQGLITPRFTEQLLKNIITESIRLQAERQKLVAFQGEHGAYGDVASRRLVPEGAYIPCLEFSDVFNGVQEGLFDHGVVPVENSLEGAVTQVNDLLTTTELKVVGEVIQPVRHCLLIPGDTDYREIHVVFSHPLALAQCRGFIERNKLDPRPFYDTAGAAKMLAGERPRAAAAIASSLSADLYGLNIVKRGIADNPANATRFLLLSREPSTENGDKCSIVFATAHKAGCLYQVLRLFAEAQVNLTRISSIPRRSDPGNYTFFLDFEGFDKDKKILELLKKVGKLTSSLSFLGCYPTDRS